MRNPDVLLTGFDRPKLFFDVQKPTNKFSVRANFLCGKKEQSGIVYCSTRVAVDEVCEKLKDLGFCAKRYHAGLSDEERKTA